MSSNQRTFKSDLEHGRSIEKKFLLLLNNDYPKLKTEHSIDKEYFSDWDISTTAYTSDQQYKIRTFEVKHNQNYSTGNCCVELGKVSKGYEIESGLSVTKADFYVFNFAEEQEFYVIPTNQLRDLINQSQTKHKYYDNYHLAFLPKQTLIQSCTKLSPKK